jgi:hypothetical protein
MLSEKYLPEPTQPLNHLTTKRNTLKIQGDQI